MKHHYQGFPSQFWPACLKVKGWLPGARRQATRLVAALGAALGVVPRSVGRRQSFWLGPTLLLATGWKEV